MKLRIFPFLLLLFSACDSNGPTDNVEAGLRTLQMKINNATPLPSGFHYEGWVTIVTDGGSSERSTGKFNIDSDGNLINLNNELIEDDLFQTAFDMTSAMHYSVSIESPQDGNSSPSMTRLLGGDFRDLRAELSTAHAGGIDERLSLSAGTFILASPTDTTSTNEDHGLWFINLTAGPLARGLRVPFPLQGWNYQGWAIIDGIEVSTGIIQGLSTSDNAAPHSGPLTGYSYPGEDFLVNPPAGLEFPTSIKGARVVVTLEPDPDIGPSASPLEILNGRVPQNSSVNFTYNLTSNFDNLPTGIVFISE